MIGSTTTTTTDLEAKRQAVLASMKKRAASRQASAEQSPAAITPPISRAGAPKHVSTFSLEDAVLDLRSMGYTFSMIVEQSGVSRGFLESCYARWNFPVPSEPIESVPASSRPPPQRTRTPQPHFHSSHAHHPPKTFFSNKVYRSTDGDKPLWLKELVINLESSDEESEDDDEEEAPLETFHESHDPSLPEIVPGDNRVSDAPDFTDDTDGYDPEEQLLPTKRRKLSNDLRFGRMTLEAIEERKQELQRKIGGLEAESQHNKERLAEMDVVFDETVRKIENLEQKAKKLGSMLQSVEAQREALKGEVASMLEESKSFETVRSDIAMYKAEMERLDFEEAKLVEAEAKRVELRNKLLKQMKDKKLKEQGSVSPVDIPTPLSTPREADMSLDDSHQLTTKKQELHDTNVYDETIHKIPKVIIPFPHLKLS